MDKSVRRGALPQRLSGLKIWQLLLLLVVVVGVGIVFIGAMAGWFNKSRVVLSREMYCGEECDEYLISIDRSEYDKLLKERKSFVLMVDQGGCKTADKVRGHIEEYASDAGIRVYRMMFDEMKESSLHEYVKYYPSVVLVSDGKVVAWLKADEDGDVGKYNNYVDFREWMDEYLRQ